MRWVKIFIFMAVCVLCVSMGEGAYPDEVQPGYFEQGNALYNQKKYQEAVSMYIRAIQANPRTKAKAYLNCARAYSMQKKFAQSLAYYRFYEGVASDAGGDKKFMAEYRAMQKRASGMKYERDATQSAVLAQLEHWISQGGAYLTRQGNGALAYYDVLIRAGYAEPALYDLQKRLVEGLVSELVREITPPLGQPLPLLDRLGWAFIRSKSEKARQFSDIALDSDIFESIEATALGWEAFYRGDYGEAQKQFLRACGSEYRIAAAYWGRVMVSFQLDDMSGMFEKIDEAERVYEAAHIDQTSAYFALLRAQAYKNQGNMSKSLEYLSVMRGAL